MCALTVHFGGELWKCLDAVQLLSWGTAQWFVFQSWLNTLWGTNPIMCSKLRHSGQPQCQKNRSSAERWKARRWGSSRAGEGQALGLGSGGQGGRRRSTTLVRLAAKAEHGGPGSRTAWVGLRSGCQPASAFSSLLLNPIICVCLVGAMLIVHWNGKSFWNAKMWVRSKK